MAPEAQRGDESYGGLRQGSVDMPDDIVRLMSKYARGRIPVLVDEDTPGNGLVNGQLLRIYQKGFEGRHLIPLGILVVRGDLRDRSRKWSEGNADFRISSWAHEDWTAVCRTIRASARGSNQCEECDRRYARRADEEKGVIAYMCTQGMIDFAMPVLVDGEVIAVISTGQRVPKEGCLWACDSLEGALFGVDDDEGTTANARDVTAARLKRAEREYGLPDGVLTRALKEDLQCRASIEVGPTDVNHIKEVLNTAGKHLSDLAQATYALEKTKCIAVLRAAIIRSVAHKHGDITDVPSTLSAAVQSLSSAASAICTYFGFDYLVALNLRREPAQLRLLLYHAPTPPPWPPGRWTEEINDQSAASLWAEVAQFPEFGDVDLWPLRNMPFFESMRAWLVGRQSSLAIAARLDYSGLPLCLLFAGRSAGLKCADLRDRDVGDLRVIVDDIGMVINLLLSIDQLDDMGRAQERFLEDVAHDIRNPVQNLLFMIERLKLDAARDVQISGEIRKLGAQVRRIHRLSQRVWLLEQIRQGWLKSNEKSRANVYQVIREAIAMVEDLVVERNVRITVDSSIEGWRSITVDRDFLYQCILNLLDNAVKYSTANAAVGIGGKMLYPRCELAICNRGVRIRDEYRDKIYERGFRTPEAQMHVREGCGIGLCIVKAFADIHGSIDVSCNPIAGTRDYLTVFRLVFSGSIL